MRKPRLLDAYCGGGGAAVGYARAGFEVVGVDNRQQKRYPFEIVEAHALEYIVEHAHEFDAIHASPPCQCYSSLKSLSRGNHPDMAEETRQTLARTGIPFVIENVVGAPLAWSLLLCGSMFGLQTKCGAQLRRHRIFETSHLIMSPGPCRHGQTTIAVQGHQATGEAARMATRRRAVIGVHGTRPTNQAPYRAEKRGMKQPAQTITIVGATPRDPAAEKRRQRTISITGNTPQDGATCNHGSPGWEGLRETFTVDEAREAMGIDWLTMKELSQAIPPAYTEWIGRQLIAIIHAERNTP